MICQSLTLAPTPNLALALTLTLTLGVLGMSFTVACAERQLSDGRAESSMSLHPFLHTTSLLPSHNLPSSFTQPPPFVKSPSPSSCSLYLFSLTHLSPQLFYSLLRLPPPLPLSYPSSSSLHAIYRVRSNHCRLFLGSMLNYLMHGADEIEIVSMSRIPWLNAALAESSSRLE